MNARSDIILMDTINPTCNCGADTETTISSITSCVADFTQFNEFSSLMAYI